MEAVIFTGLQGAGKSTFYQRTFAGTHAHINLDTFKTRHREMAAIQGCIALRQQFVVDNTNPTVADRKRYIETAKAAGYTVAGYCFESRIQDCLRRNLERAGKARVPPQGLYATLKKMQPPSHEEGFDSLFYVQIISGGEFIVQPLEGARVIGGTP